MKIQTIFLTLLLFSSQSFGWGALGHRTIGEIAQTQLSPHTLTQVKQLLGDDSLADVANWADQLRSEDTYKQTMWYHFEKMDDNTTFIPHLRSLPDWQLKKGGVVMAILLAVDNLKNPAVSQKEKTDSLKFLIHFVGDVHQPLHTGPAKDNGGVKEIIKWFGVPMSLHKVWDSAMMYDGHKEIFGEPTFIADNAKAYAQFLMKQNASNPSAKEYDVEAWLNESLSFRKQAYDESYETDQRLYQATNLPVVDRRLYQAGIRLGALLNDIYDGSPMSRAQDFWNRILTVTNPRDFVSFKP